MCILVLMTFLKIRLLEASLHTVNRRRSTEISLSLSTDGVAFTGWRLLIVKR